MQRRIFAGLYYLLLIIGAISFIYPFIWMFFASLKPLQDIFSINPIPSKITLEWYAVLLEKLPVKGGFFRGLLNSFIVSTAISLLQIFFGALTGYALARMKFKGRNLLFAVILFTMVIPGQLTLIPLYLLMVKLGWLNSYACLIIPGMMGGFSIFLFRQFFLTMPADLIEAGKLDGLNDFGVLFKVFLPLAKPAAITAGLLSFIGSWNEVLWPMVVIDDWKMMTLPQMITQYQLGGLAGGMVATQMASTMLMIIPVFTAYIFFQKYFIEGLAASGLK